MKSMKAFAPIEKDSLILISILSEDLPELFKEVADDEFSKNIVYMQGVAHKMDMEFDDTRKYFRSELKTMIDDKSWKAVNQFFNTFADKLSMVDVENRNNIIYCTTFAYRFLYNLYFLGNPAKGLKEKIMSLEGDRENLLFNSKSISALKSLITNEDEDFVQKSFVEMSEVFYYLPSLKSASFTSDEFREALTHGITGCFLLEENNEKLASSLSKDFTIENILENVKA